MKTLLRAAGCNKSLSNCSCLLQAKTLIEKMATVIINLLLQNMYVQCNCKCSLRWNLSKCPTSSINCWQLHIDVFSPGWNLIYKVKLISRLYRIQVGIKWRNEIKTALPFRKWNEMNYVKDVQPTWVFYPVWKSPQ